MKAAVAGIGAAVAAPACCIGPVVFTLLGAGALSAASLQLVPYRPWLVGLTVCRGDADFGNDLLRGNAQPGYFREPLHRVRMTAVG
jgi:mercuric ion transport protein